MTKRTGIPAVPGNLAVELFNLLNALKQNLERLEKSVLVNADLLDKAVKYSDGHIFTNDKIASGTFQPNPANGALQRIMNGGAHNLAPPTQNCLMTILYQNTAAAGTITTSAFTKVTGTAPVTTTQLLFMGRITVIEGKSWLEWQALQ